MPTVAAPVLERIRRAPPWQLDAVVATAFVVAGLTTRTDPVEMYEPRDGAAVVLVLAATVPFYLRRTAPLPVFALSLCAVAALFVAGYDAGPLPMVVAVGLYTVAAYRPLPEAVVAVVATNVALVVMLVADSPGFANAEFTVSVAAFGATGLLGWTMQSRRLRLDALEREEGEAARRAVADERLRIAQELHDVVAHSLGVIAVQAGVGMKVLDTDVEEARRALEHISSSSRSSLAEIRRVLGLVRSGDPAAAYEPAPGLSDLRRLAAEVVGAGLSVKLDVAGDVADVPVGVELAAYRIVQEALTNALRHASAHRATVRIEVAAGAVRITVGDDGSGPVPTGRPGGHGLVGMRERVAVYGGTLDAGPRPGGGFQVEATLPYRQPVAR